MKYAHVNTNKEIDDIREKLPRVYFDGRHWYDLRRESSKNMQDSGWYEIIQTDKPEDVPGGSWMLEVSYILETDKVQQVWVFKEFTEEELTLQEERILAQRKQDSFESILMATVHFIEEAHNDKEDWVRPTGAHDSYARDVVVNHNGRMYRSKIFANYTEPGSDIRWWEDVTEEEISTDPVPWYPAQWVKGSLVIYEGKTYLALKDILDPNWAPGPALWAYWELQS